VPWCTRYTAVCQGVPREPTTNTMDGIRGIQQENITNTMDDISDIQEACTRLPDALGRIPLFVHHGAHDLWSRTDGDGRCPAHLLLAVPCMPPSHPTPGSHPGEIVALRVTEAVTDHSAATTTTDGTVRPRGRPQKLNPGLFVSRGERAQPGYRNLFMGSCQRIVVVDNCLGDHVSTTSGKSPGKILGLSTTRGFKVDQINFIIIILCPDRPDLPQPWPPRQQAKKTPTSCRCFDLPNHEDTAIATAKTFRECQR
jgi:hypothetical protein